MFRIITFVAIVLAATNAISDVEWAIFKSRHGKVYKSDREESFRRYIYKVNMQKVKEHNILYAKGVKSYYLGENKFADMTFEEFNKTINIQMRPSNMQKTTRKTFRPRNNVTKVPDTIDWVKKGYVTAVQDQGNCASYPFAVTGSIEGAWYKAKHQLVKLSEQQIIDCSTSEGNNGCTEGTTNDGYHYAEEYGICTEASYAYTGETGKCAKCSDVGAHIYTSSFIHEGSESSLMEGLAEVGPIASTICACHHGFHLYKGGVFEEPYCGSEGTHSILIVGYGTDDSKDYWLVKNSWGTSWGEDGYIRMRRNYNNMCGIANSCEYPIV